jgi:hypothetical protein
MLTPDQFRAAIGPAAEQFTDIEIERLRVACDRFAAAILASLADTLPSHPCTVNQTNNSIASSSVE